MKKILFSLQLAGLTLLSTSAFAATVESLLAAGTAEEVGHAIAKEADDRDFGFGDYEVDVLMELKNARGQSSKREMRNKTFEMPDLTVGDKTMIVFDRPRDVKGTAFLTFSKILEADDQWLFLPKLGKVKRISSKNKSGPFMGSEFSYEDIGSPELGKYTYKYVGRENCENGMDCLKVERYPLYKHSGYTKQVVWYDTEHYRFWRIDSYDRKGELMKIMTIDGYQEYLDKYWRPALYKMDNVQTKKSTALSWENYKFRIGLKENDFTKSDLKNVK